MSKPSQVVILVEDQRQQQLIRRYLRQLGLDSHAMRFQLPTSGSGEQWVREQFPVELTAYRRRTARAETKLILVVDADTMIVADRLAQLDQQLAQTNIHPVHVDTEQVARLAPKRNVETWILCLVGTAVNETDDYKRTRNDWSDLIPSAAE